MTVRLEVRVDPFAAQVFRAGEDGLEMSEKARTHDALCWAAPPLSSRTEASPSPCCPCLLAGLDQAIRIPLIAFFHASAFSTANAC